MHEVIYAIFAVVESEAASVVIFRLSNFRSEIQQYVIITIVILCYYRALNVKVRH